MYTGAIWKKRGQSGVEYLSLSIQNPNNPDEKWNMIAFLTKEKKQANSPDYSVFFDTPEEKERKEAEQRASREQTFQQEEQVAPDIQETADQMQAEADWEPNDTPGSEDISVEDIPF